MNLLTAKQVIAAMKVSRPFLYKLMKEDSSFPKPANIGFGEGRAATPRWSEEALNDWIKNKQVTQDENRRIGAGVHQDPRQESAAQS